MKEASVALCDFSETWSEEREMEHGRINLSGSGYLRGGIDCLN
jgi:hypothetical protein